MYNAFQEIMQIKEHCLIDSGMEVKDSLKNFKGTRDIVLRLVETFYQHWKKNAKSLLKSTN